MKIDPSRAIGGYAALMTLAFGWAALGGAAKAPPTLGEINVEKINVRERDGTLRMVIAGRDRIGGIIQGDREWPHPSRTQAGIIFYNDEGTENGGLVFDGRLNNGKPTNSGSLTFDRWRQDQTIQMRSIEDGPLKTAGFVVNDRPDRPLEWDRVERIRAMPEGPAKEAAYEAAGFGNAERAYLGSRADRSSELALRDAAGRPRLVLRVGADGASSIRFLDEQGRVARTMTPP